MIDERIDWTGVSACVSPRVWPGINLGCICVRVGMRIEPSVLLFSTRLFRAAAASRY